ncbi:MAG: GAF and ANTAR domain-containing protein [Acidimicrobiales bacterium]
MSVREEQLNRTFVELADTLVNHFDVAELLHTLATRCVELFDVDAAGLMLADERGALRVVASSNEQTRMLELFEIQSQEGPCSDCYRDGRTVTEDDLDRSQRWPRFRQEALAAGFRAALAVPMSLRDETIGALNLFRARPGALDEADLASCRALADVATIALIQERALREARLIAEQLQVALNSRVLIEQAKGVLAGLANVDMDAAFKMLRGYARAENLLLVSVARDLIEGRLSPGTLGIPGA